MTAIVVFFSWQHSQNQQAASQSDTSVATTTNFTVTEPVPIPPAAVDVAPSSDSDNSQSNTQSPDRPVLDDMTACTMDAKMCPDGSFVGRAGPDCEFAACPSNVPPYTACEPSDRLAEACIEIYAPVCGLQQVQCVTTPCNPVPVNFSNGCFACMDDTVTGYTEGVCANDSE